MTRLKTRSPRKSRGFTLIELMVALTGGLFVSMAVFALARDGSRFYQRESRLANATLGSVLGFERLRGDLSRAGFLTTPNIRRDPGVCLAPVGGWPAELLHAASMRITPGGSPANATLNAAGLTPASIVLAGSYASIDEFPVREVVVAGAGHQVYLQTAVGAMTRLGYDIAAPAATGQQILLNVFGLNRVLRIVDDTGKQHFGVITGVQGGPNPSILTSNNPLLTLRLSPTGQALNCGIPGLGTQSMANVVNFVRYEVRNVSADPVYAPAYNATVPFENTRTDLVREELDANGNPIAGTLELIAEYAIDLSFNLVAVSNVTGAPGNPNLLPGDLTLIAPGAANYANFAGDTTAGATPQRVRALVARLSVRSREADRDGPVLVGGVISPWYRIGLGAGNSAPFARVRTQQATIALYNQTRPLW